MDPPLIQVQSLPRIMVSCVKSKKKKKKKTLKNSINEKTLWKTHLVRTNFQADSTLLQPTPSPGAYLAGKSQTIGEAVPANFLQGTCNFLLGLSSHWLITASEKKVRSTVFCRTGSTFSLLSETALRVSNLTHQIWTKAVKWRRA